MEEPMRLALTGLICIGMVIPASTIGPDVTAKIIERDIYYHVPLGPCGVAGALMLITRATGIPGGVEYVPGDCDFAAWPGAPAAAEKERVFLSGLTVAEALNRLISHDLRYRWGVSDGVIVVRPVRAWADARHFLHRTMPSFGVVDHNVGGALHLWLAAVGGKEQSDELLRARAMRTAEGNRQFSVPARGPVSAVEALDDIVRAHGALYWEIRYCQPDVESKYATLFLWTLEDDPTGIGAPLPGRYTTVNRKTLDACQGRR
jgi:hypothetical protein